VSPISKAPPNKPLQLSGQRTGVPAQRDSAVHWFLQLQVGPAAERPVRWAVILELRGSSSSGLRRGPSGKP